MLALFIFIRILSVISVKVEGNVLTQNVISLEMAEHDNTTLNISVFQLPSRTKKHNICYHSSSLENMAKFSLVICKQSGFQALQRIYSLDQKTFQNSFGKGVAVDVQCNGNETSIDYCDWKSQFISSCNEFLVVECTSCKHSLTIEDGERNSFELPTSVSCQPFQICEWKITRKSWIKAMRVKFQRIKSSMQENILQTNGEVLEMKWMDNKTVGRIVKLGNEITSGNIVTINIPSNTMSLLYIPSYICNKIVMDKITAVFYEDMSKDYYSEGSNSSQTLILSSVSCLVLLSIAIVLVCCERQKWKKHFSPQYNKQTSWKWSWFSHYTDSSQDSKTRREMTNFTSFSSISADTAVAEKDINGSRMGIIAENETNCTSPLRSNISFNNSMKNKQIFSSQSQGAYDFITDDISYSRTRKVTYKRKNGNFFSSLRHSFLPCFYTHSPRLCRNLVHQRARLGTRRKLSTELEDSSLESLCSKFNNSVLKLQWSDRSSMSVSDPSLKSETEEITLGLSNKYYDQFININCLWKANKEIQGTSSMLELCSCDSDATSVQSFKSLESGETYYSAWQHSRPSVAFSESDTFGSLSFECPSPISDAFERSTDKVV